MGFAMLMTLNLGKRRKSVNAKVLEILQAGRDSLVSEIRQVDLAIETTTAAHGRENEAVNIMLEGRARLQAQIDVLDQTMNRVRLVAEGKELETAGETKAVIPGQYSGMKLSTAVQAYLSDRGRGPVGCRKLVEDLTLAGVRVEMKRSKLHKGEARDLDTRDLRLLAANNTKRYAYDSTTDSLSLIPAAGNDTGWKRQRKSRVEKALVPATANV
jgi:hypothetical protein